MKKEKLLLAVTLVTTLILNQGIASASKLKVVQGNDDDDEVLSTIQSDPHSKKSAPKKAAASDPVSKPAAKPVAKPASSNATAAPQAAPTPKPKKAPAPAKSAASKTSAEAGSEIKVDTENNRITTSKLSFVPNSDTLNPGVEETLKQVAQFLNQSKPDLIIQVIAHTDSFNANRGSLMLQFDLASTCSGCVQFWS